MGGDGYGVNIRTEPKEDEEDGEHDFWCFMLIDVVFLSLYYLGDGECWMNKYLEA